VSGGDRLVSLVPLEEDPAGIPRASLRDLQRAFARLIVSDIRLYHEEDVAEGRAAGDLATRLSALLRTARDRYLRRFSTTDPAAAVFDEEVLRVLAGGDASKLG
jgi:hypothetical protein